MVLLYNPISIKFWYKEGSYIYWSKIFSAFFHSSFSVFNNLGSNSKIQFDVISFEVSLNSFIYYFSFNLNLKIIKNKNN